jgi:hypothetical protein
MSQIGDAVALAFLVVTPYDIFKLNNEKDFDDNR